MKQTRLFENMTGNVVGETDLERESSNLTKCHETENFPSYPNVVMYVRRKDYAHAAGKRLVPNSSREEEATQNDRFGNRDQSRQLQATEIWKINANIL